MTPHTPITDQLGEPLGKILGVVGRGLRSLLDERLKPLDLGGSRWCVLLVLDILGEPSPQKLIAQHIGIEGATLVGVLDELEERGLVRRKPDNRDRRVKLVELLPGAVPLLKRVVSEGSAMEDEVFGVLPADHRKQLRQDMLIVRQRLGAMLGKEPVDSL